MQKWNWKHAAAGIAVILLLSLTMLLVLYQQWDRVLASLAAVSWGSLTLLILLGLLATVFDSLSHWAMVRTSLGNFTPGRAIELVYLALFSNIATLTAGTLPLQGYYLHQHGMMAGAGVGTLLVEYTLHKAMVLCYAAVLLLFGSGWLTLHSTGYMGYLWAGYGVAILIITFLVVICCSSRIQVFLSKLIDRAPAKGSMAARKATWQFQLSALGEQSRRIFQSRRACLLSVLFTVLKLFTLYSIPFVCLRALGADGLRYGQVQLLAALMELLAGAIPNIGGIGPTEASFLLIFSPFVGQTAAISALILYRIVTYYIPFLLGGAVLLRWQRSIRPREKCSVGG